MYRFCEKYFLFLYLKMFLILFSYKVLTLIVMLFCSHMYFEKRNFFVQFCGPWVLCAQWGGFFQMSLHFMDGKCKIKKKTFPFHYIHHKFITYKMSSRVQCFFINKIFYLNRMHRLAIFFLSNNSSWWKPLFWLILCCSSRFCTRIIWTYEQTKKSKTFTKIT